MNFDFKKDFTQEQIDYLQTMSKEDLIELGNKCKSSSILSNTNQLNRKILINALYGAMGNIHFRYYDIRNAAAITTLGQLAIQWSARYIDKYMNGIIKPETPKEYTIYIDTDSNYIEVTDVIEKVGEDKFKTTNDKVDFLDKFAQKKILPMLEGAFVDLQDYMNNYKNMMEMDREAIACAPLGSNGACSFFKAKKRYALNVYDMEGTRYKTPKMKIMGIETQQSSTPKACQVALTESIRLILQEGESSLQDYYKEFEQQHKTLGYMNIAGTKSANNIQKYNVNGFPGLKCPNQIRGVLAYKRAIAGTTAPDVQEGEKVMILPLKDGNPFGDKVIAWTSGIELPIEIREEVLRWIDYQDLFYKTYQKPLASICESSGMNYEHQSTLSDLFDF